MKPLALCAFVLLVPNLLLATPPDIQKCSLKLNGSPEQRACFEKVRPKYQKKFQHKQVYPWTWWLVYIDDKLNIRDAEYQLARALYEQHMGSYAGQGSDDGQNGQVQAEVMDSSTGTPQTAQSSPTYSSPTAPRSPSYSVPAAPATTSTSHIVAGLPQCARAQNEGNTLYIVNSCAVPVSVSFTSDGGNIWGKSDDIGPYSRSAVEILGAYDPHKDGNVHLFTCPKGASPQLLNGSFAIPNTYNGGYRCYEP